MSTKASRPPRADSLQALCDEGLRFELAGRPDEARRCYQRVLQREPGHFNGLCLMAGLCASAGQADLAISLIRRAIRGAPGGPSASVGLAAAHSDLGNLLGAAGRHREALANLDKAVELQPGAGLYHCNRGIQLLRMGQAADALDSIERGIIHDPLDANAHFSRGAALDAMQRRSEAVSAYDRAIALRPDFAAAFVNRGNALVALEQDEVALRSYDRAIALAPTLPEAHIGRTSTLFRLARFEDALASAETAVTLTPDAPDAHIHRAAALFLLDRNLDALASYDRAIALAPRDELAHFGRAAVLNALNRVDEARTGFDAAIALKPDYAEAHFQKSLVLLRVGDFEAGWLEYEWRLKRPRGDGRQPDPARLWLGTPSLSGETLFVYHEQGLGDVIQFCRLIPIVAKRAGRTIVAVQGSLRALIQRMDPACATIPADETPEAYDVQCPLLSLPLALGMTLDTIPASDAYLRADAALRTEFEALLGEWRRPRIGLAWSGNPTHDNDRNRSMRFAQVLPLLSGRADFVSIQKEIRPRDSRLLADTAQVRVFGDRLTDFDQTAALVDSLDLVISVDTSVAHLAGALGKPVWILLPFSADWRWLRDRDDSPWYPSARLFRQSSVGDWDGVIERVARDLEVWLLTHAALIKGRRADRSAVARPEP